MDNVEWHPFFYNGLETNVEVTRCGRVRRVPKHWMNNYKPTEEVDFSKFKKNIKQILKKNDYKNINFQYDGCNGYGRLMAVHLIVAMVFLNHKLSDFHKNRIVVDHIDSNRHNNHVDNLQLITHRENTSKERTLRSGLPVGVVYRKIYKKYEVSIWITSSLKYLGVYTNVEEASQVYQDALKALNQFLKDTDNKGDAEEWHRSYYEKIKKVKPKKSGLPKGVLYYYNKKIFQAQIQINKNKIYLGTYKIVTHASNAYQEAASSLEAWISENKDPNDWITEYKNKVKNESEYRQKLNKSVELTESKPSNIGEQLSIQFN